VQVTLSAIATGAASSGMSATGRYLWEPEGIVSETWQTQEIVVENWVVQSTGSQNWVVQ
jgi:hypothetical protein